MRTYRDLFRVPEFTPMFAAMSCNVAGGTVAGLALATLVFDRTGSALLAAMSMFGSSFAQVLGATMLLSAGDRLPPRRTMTCLALIFAAADLAMALPGTTIPVILAITLAVGLVNSVGGAVRWGLVTDILPEDGYILGRSVLNMSVGVMQILGNGLGAALLQFMSPRAALVLSAVLYVIGALVTRFGLARRPPRATGRPSVRRTWSVNRQLLSDPAVRCVYLALWVPNGLVVGAEALYVPYAGTSAGALFMAGAFGMFVGDTVMGRFLPEHWRGALITPVRLLLAAPYVLFLFRPNLPESIVAVAIASVGFSAGLLLQDRLVALTPTAIRGQALGLHSSGMLTMQAVGATIAGAIAERLSAAATMSIMAVMSILVTLALTPGLRQPVPPLEPATAH